MQREEKVLDACLEEMITKVQDIKGSIAQLLFKIEHQSQVTNWTSVLDSYAVISGQIRSLNNTLRSEKTPFLRNLATLPICLSQERDESLEKLTEGRVPAFNHEVVPDYLRTKLEPSIENRESDLKKYAGNISTDAGQKQVNQMNKMVNNLLSLIHNARDEWDAESINSARGILQQTTAPADTNALISAVSFGKGLKTNIRPGVGRDLSPMSVPPPTPGPPTVTSQTPVPSPLMGKATSSIKTNIKSGSAGGAPYSRQRGGPRN